ncbi:MAG: hypothetical protein EOO01_31775 [Chitinophagaceae bacterium]|nr:MAG: hypothetical protein EOO01_31775 [Chitinophagaceae bacterium]
MKTLLLSLLLLTAVVLFSCGGSQRVVNSQAASGNDTIRIANDSLEYEVIIIDAGFNTWLASVAKPRNFYSQQYFENRNVTWVSEWNRRARNPLQFGDMYQMEIDYRPGIDYGYEVNYLLFNYLVYFQQRNQQRLGTFQPNP